MKVTPVKGRQGNAIVRFQDWVVNKDGPHSVIGIFSHGSEVPEIGKEVDVMISGVKIEEGKVRWLWLTVLNEDMVRVKYDGFIKGNNGIVSYGYSWPCDDVTRQDAARFWLTPGVTGVHVVNSDEFTTPGVGYVSLMELIGSTKRSLRLHGVDHYEMLGCWQQLSSNQPLKVEEK